MASHNVQYEISLKDLLSGKIKEAEGHVNHFEKTLGNTTNLTKQLMGAAVGFFGAYQALEFVKGSVEAYNVQERALSQLRAGLQSTKGAAGVTYDEMIAQADKFKATTIYDDDVINDMQAQLLSFPEVTKAVFEDAEVAIMDLATRTHRGLNEVSVMVGKALSDPAKGVAALHRVGVEFSESQIKVIKHLQDTNQLAAAQKLILQELSKEYGGSTAEASADAAGQMEILKHEFEDVKEDVGKLVMEYSIKLAPTVKNLIKDAKEFVHWLDENKEAIVSTGKAVIEITAIMWAWGKTTALIEGSVAAWKTLQGVVVATKTAIQGTSAAGAVAATETAVASEVAAGTVVGAGGMLIGAGAVFAMAAAVYQFYQEYLSKITNYLDGNGFENNATLDAVKQSERRSKELNKKYEENATQALRRATTYQPDAKKFNQGDALSIMRNINEVDNPYGDKVDNIDLAKNYETVYRSIKDDKINGKATEASKITEAQFAKMVSTSTELQKAIVDMNSYERVHLFEILDKLVKPSKKGNTVSGELTAAQQGVTGQNVKNYHITINGGLVHSFTVKSNTVKEAMPDLKRVVTSTLTDGLNDAEVGN